MLCPQSRVSTASLFVEFPCVEKLGKVFPRWDGAVLVRNLAPSNAGIEEGFDRVVVPREPLLRRKRWIQAITDECANEGEKRPFVDDRIQKRLEIRHGSPRLRIGVWRTRCRQKRTVSILQPGGHSI